MWKALRPNITRPITAEIIIKEDAHAYSLGMFAVAQKGIRLVSTDDLYYYIRRHSFFLVSSSGFKNEWKAKPRMYYFKFWIRRAEGGGFIIRRGLGWEISKKIMKVKKS